MHNANDAYANYFGNQSHTRISELRIMQSAHSEERACTHVLMQTAKQLQRVIDDFGTSAQVTGWRPGPSASLFEVELSNDTTITRLVQLADDIALRLGVTAVRIARIPETALMGIEVPNKERALVKFGDIVPAPADPGLDAPIGEGYNGELVSVDLAREGSLLAA